MAKRWRGNKLRQPWHRVSSNLHCLNARLWQQQNENDQTARRCLSRDRCWLHVTI